MYISIIEASLGITAASLPMLRPVFAKMSMPSSFPLYGESRRRGTTHIYTKGRLQGSSSKEQLKEPGVGEIQNETGPWMLGRSHGDGVSDPVARPGVATYISSSGLEASCGVGRPVDEIELRSDIQFEE